MAKKVVSRDNEHQINVSFRAKSAGVSLVVVLMIGIYYVVNMLSLLPSDQAVPDGALGLVLTVIILSVVVETALQIVLFAGAGQVENRTERDDTVNRMSTRNAYFILSVGVMIVFSSMFVGFTRFAMGSILLLVFLLAELVKFASQILYYRRLA